MGLQSTLAAEIRMNELDPIARCNPSGLVLLGKNETAVVFDNQVSVAFLKMADEIRDGSLLRDPLIETVHYDLDLFRHRFYPPHVDGKSHNPDSF